MNIKRVIWLALLVFPLTGCAGVFTVKPTPAPVDNTFTESVRDLPQVSDVEVQKLPESPKAFAATGPNGESVVGFTPKGVDQLRELRAVAKANTRVAEGALDALNATIAERNAVVRLGKQEEQRANHYAEEWAKADTALRQEQRDRKLSDWTQRALFVLSIFLLK